MKHDIIAFFAFDDVQIDFAFRGNWTTIHLSTLIIAKTMPDEIAHVFIKYIIALKNEWQNKRISKNGNGESSMLALSASLSDGAGVWANICWFQRFCMTPANTRPNTSAI